MMTAATHHSGCATDPGPHRPANEDRVYADDESGIFLVVDGLGGHAAGELAAQTAMEVIVGELRTPSADTGEQRVRTAITRANNEIFRLAQLDSQNAGMACVLTVALAQDDTLTIGHVGDSRLYLIWNGALRKLTSDHSPVGEQEDAGELTEAEAMRHPRRNEVFRDVGSRARGPDDADFIEIKSLPFHPGAALLLCTDGLTDALSSLEIGAIVETYSGDPATVAERLVATANERGGVDNVSVVFVAGREFMGVNSPSMLEARTRHAITRVRRVRARWRRRAGRVFWVAVGMVLGILLWILAERFLHPALRQAGLILPAWFPGSR